MPSEHDQVPIDPETVEDLQRREMLVKLGQYAGFTAPVLLTLLKPRSARAFDAPPGSPL